MMGDLILRPLHVGTIQRDESIFSYIKNMGTQIEAPVLAWYIEGNGSRILVDTGGQDRVNGQFHPPYTRESGQDPVTRLAALGVELEEHTVARYRLD